MRTENCPAGSDSINTVLKYTGELTHLNVLVYLKPLGLWHNIREVERPPLPHQIILIMNFQSTRYEHGGSESTDLILQTKKRYSFLYLRKFNFRVRGQHLSYFPILWIDLLIEYMYWKYRRKTFSLAIQKTLFFGEDMQIDMSLSHDDTIVKCHCRNQV